MKRFFLVAIGSVLALGSTAEAAARALWRLPSNAIFNDLGSPLKMRGDGKLAVHWTHEGEPGQGWTDHRTLLDLRTGREVASEQMTDESRPDRIEREAWGARQTHAFLPSQDKTWIRLKNGGTYRVLRFLPRFDEESLQDLRFTPDGGTLYVLGQNTLWKVGAQSGRLLAVVHAQSGRWSRENAALSPDARQIVAMRGRVTLFSTRTGRVVRRFGVSLETFTGSCGSLEARVGFVPDGHIFAQMQGDQTWFYSPRGRSLWHGQTPFITEFSPGGCVIDTPRFDDYGHDNIVFRRASDGKAIAQVPDFHPEQPLNVPIAITPDSRTLFYIKGNAVWKIAWPVAPRSRS